MLIAVFLAATLDTFNNALIDATKRVDNAAVLRLWEQDGVSLLPSKAPIVGKPAIGKFLDEVTSKYPAARMESFTLECREIAVSGDLASEWCTEHQIVSFGDKREPFDGRGKMLLVLHRGRDGNWRIKSEMWNQGGE
ncbi:MAG TPA: nuclear transport factor 2 family protein [Thermoanaerobaculia bacterium]|nr:nuclear transport factor 2 family protein [Thermoanaerobaculia bacterium]